VFIDHNKDDVVEGCRLGVEPICEALQVAPSTYYAARGRPPSARERRDQELTPRLVGIWKDNYQVYGARKLWKAAQRAGIEIGRDQTARLMRRAQIQGVLRSKRVRTTRRDQEAGRHPDLVKRQFTATAPNQLWVTDLTFVATWAGVAYVCFIVDAFSRMIVGWRVASHMRTPMVLDAIEMARWSRGLRHPGLRCHSDAGSQFTSIRYGERLAEIGAVPSIGTVGDSYDNALAETVNGYYKAELIRGPARTGPWKTIDEVELATLGWVHWHNTQRLHGYLGDIPPVEFEALHAADGELEAPDPDDPTIADTAPRAADRLPAPQTEPRDRQIASNPPPDPVTGPTAPAPTPTARPSRPPTPAGTVTIMCGSPGSGIHRTRGRSRITDGAAQEPESEQPH
jgi:putative transposase